MNFDAAELIVSSAQILWLEQITKRLPDGLEEVKDFTTCAQRLLPIQALNKGRCKSL